MAQDAANDAAEQARYNGGTEDTPAGPDTPVAVQPDPHAPVAPEAPAADEAEDTFDGGQFNPDTLDPALQPGWKQLQAAFIQKTQALAEERKQYEELGGVEAVQQAIELRQRISDPSNWQQLHAELTAALRQSGALPEEPVLAAPAATEVPGSDDVDPDLAPVLKQMQEMRAKLDSFEAERQAAVQQERQALERERQQAAFLGELTRQEEVIRDANPHYKQENIDAIYDLAPSFGGNLLQAAERYAAIVDSARSEWFNSKQSVAERKSVQPIPAGGAGGAPRPAPATTEAAGAEMEEQLRQLIASGEVELNF